MSSGLARRALAEFVGTAFLVAAVVGSGIAAARLSPHDVGLQLLENSVITGAALVALILALQPVSAAFNPVVTLVERAFGAVTTMTAAALIAAQLAGGVLGAVVANLMFDLDAINLSTHHRTGAGIWLGEVVATLGLLVVIFGTVRSGRADRVAYAVGGYILAAYWFTSSTSFANPAVAVARMFSNTFAGIAPASVPMFVVMQLVGGALGYVLIRALYPHAIRLAVDVAADHASDSSSRLPGAMPMPDKPSVLFVCVHNAGRSQMAAGLAAPHRGGRGRGPLRGLRTCRPDQPRRHRSDGEVGIDITAEQPKILTVDAVRDSDVVITMGCGDTCPIFPGKRYEDWDLPDPAGQGIDDGAAASATRSATGSRPSSTNCCRPAEPRADSRASRRGRSPLRRACGRGASR